MASFPMDNLENAFYLLDQQRRRCDDSCSLGKTDKYCEHTLQFVVTVNPEDELVVCFCEMKLDTLPTNGQSVKTFWRKVLSADEAGERLSSLAHWNEVLEWVVYPNHVIVTSDSFKKSRQELDKPFKLVPPNAGQAMMSAPLRILAAAAN